MAIHDVDLRIRGQTWQTLGHHGCRCKVRIPPDSGVPNSAIPHISRVALASGSSRKPWASAQRLILFPGELGTTEIGKAEKGRFIGRVWQAMRLLETVLEELDADGWELVTTSFSGTLAFYGTAVLRKPTERD